MSRYSRLSAEQKIKVNAASKRWRERNLEKISAKRRAYVAANRANVNSQQKHYHRSYYETVSGRIVALLGVARVRAKKQGLEFSLDKEWVAARMQAGVCELTGITFDLSREGLEFKFRAPFAPSIDRKDNSKGYTADNCRMVCVVANYAMNEWGLSPVLKFAEELLKAHARRMEEGLV